MNWINATFVTGLLTLWAYTAQANCIEEAADYQGVSAQLLYTIASLESDLNPQAINRNAHSVDIGLFQINSRHLDKLAKYGINAVDLLDPCVSAHVGAWILADNISRYGETWEAVGAYNALTPSKRRVYEQKIQRRYQKLFGQRAGL
ncbi:MAG: hypothetical protein AMS22_11450 [Thiotrichales bacterium SG8_50]|nr:MAG: hypothetical protein AMS22_11450 [Thiotrichales bacterium SG8_50]